MTVGTLIVIALTVVFTSFLSGVFGMAGGMILLGVLLLFLDVIPAMVLFSTIQLASNGWRVMMWRKHIRWRIFFLYVGGAAVAFFVMRWIAFVPDKATVYIALGLLPFMVELLPVKARPNIEWRGVPVLTGFLTTIIQLLVGVGGLFLDIFFQKSMLDRKTTVATKAATQTFGHLLRGAYFGSFLTFSEAVPVAVFGPIVVLAILGASLAPFVLERLTDQGFRVWTRRVIFAVAITYLLRGAWLLMHA
ncbi:MAG: TSUP family transporter [Xanthobacteraceae bacterium]|nr:TSUP family transporter [Xanthobacteraceae bacterium]